MKKSGIAHAELNRQLALLGHTDRFVVADCGLPLPRTMPVIDLALAAGQLDFRTVLDTLLREIVVQRHVVATEAATSPAGQWFTDRAELLGSKQTVSHAEFKELLSGCVFAIRTGEQTPYANVICESGVPF
ncbi:MAG: D-ribose pyranase [Propionibacteriaceae bacterium]